MRLWSPSAPWIIAAALSLAGWVTGASAASDPGRRLVIHPVDLPPQAIKGDPPRGIVVDAVNAIAREAGFEPVIEFLPWKRAQQVVADGQDLIIAGFARTSSREDRYTWIGPIFSMPRVFVSLDKPINSYAQARAETRIIGIDLGYAQAELLTRNGLSPEQIREIPAGTPREALLAERRIDAWYQSKDTVQWYLRSRPPVPGLVIGAPVDTLDQYMACSRRCDPVIAQRLRDAMDRVRARGEIDRIVATYR